MESGERLNERANPDWIFGWSALSVAEQPLNRPDHNADENVGDDSVVNPVAGEAANEVEVAHGS
jgi:hypothetical protein